jgi:hypothetical protein
MNIGDITTLPQVIGPDQEDPERWWVFTGDSFCGFKSLDEALKLSRQLREKGIANEKEVSGDSITGHDDSGNSDVRKQ